MDAWIALDTGLSVYKDYSAFGIPHAVVVDQGGVVAAVLNPKDLTESVIDAVLAGNFQESGVACTGWLIPKCSSQ